ncbi:MAG: hypothetical protein R6W77_13670 [Trueperaceae bacterium]
MSSRVTSVTLHVVGPVHVRADGHTVRLRHKGLAILCVLALDGSVRRERLADLLWETPRAMQNLRVELHRVRAAFLALGIDPFGGGTDPLTLSDQIAVNKDAAAGAPLEGLDDVSPEFQAWLDYKRSTWVPLGSHTARRRLVEELARAAVPGFVIVLQGSPGSGRAAVARTLAQRLALPFVEEAGTALGISALRYVDPESCDPVATAHRIANDRANVWVLGRSTFGEDPSLLLRLRSTLPPERLRFVRLEPLTWDEARNAIPESIHFDEAATMYLASAGNPGYLAELVKLRRSGHIVPPLPIPQRMRAAYELEARRLSKLARQALERLSLIEGTISGKELDALGATPYIEELERCGWLVYEGAAWRFADAAAARSLRGEIHEGERKRIRTVIDACSLDETRRGSGTEQQPGGRPLGGGPVGNGQAHAHLQPAIIPMGRGEEVWLDDARVVGPAATLAGDAVTWVHSDARDHSSEIVWSLPETPVLLHLAGRVVRGGSDGTHAVARPPCHLLRLSLVGGSTHDLLLSFDGPNTRRGGGQMAVPLHPVFDLWFLVPAGRMVRLTGAPHAMVAEFAVRAYRPVDAPRGPEKAVNALAWGRVAAEGAGARSRQGDNDVDTAVGREVSKVRS